LKIDDSIYKMRTSDALFCAEDRLRNKKFWLWIEKAIVQKKNQQEKVIVVDAGAWIGTLWIFALLLGADKCYFLEENKQTVLLMQQFLNNLGLEGRAEVLCVDATTMNELPEKYDIFISETLSSGFVEEDFVKIIKNLKKYENEWANIIPQSFDISIKINNKKINNSDVDNKLFSKKYQIEHLLNDPRIRLFGVTENEITFEMHAEVFDDIWIDSWSCMSFLNPRNFDLKNEHPVFVIEFDWS